MYIDSFPSPFPSPSSLFFPSLLFPLSSFPPLFYFPLLSLPPFLFSFSLPFTFTCITSLPLLFHLSFLSHLSLFLPSYSSFFHAPFLPSLFPFLPHSYQVVLAGGQAKSNDDLSTSDSLPTRGQTSTVNY